MARLRYGTIAVNVWAGRASCCRRPRGAPSPGHTLAAIDSGTGIVHNALLFDRPEKTVVRGPFAPFPRTLAARRLHVSPKPPWFVSARSARRTGQLLTQFAAKPSWSKLPGIFVSAFRA